MLKKEHFIVEVDSVCFSSLSHLFEPLGIEVPYRSCRPSDPVDLSLIAGSQNQLISATVSMVIPPGNPQGERPLVIVVPDKQTCPSMLLLRLYARAEKLIPKNSSV